MVDTWGRADFSSVMMPPHKRAAAGHETLAGLVVVILEDDELVRRATERMLKRLGAEVVGAASSGEALAQLFDRRLIPNAVVADYWLNQQENGSEAVHRLVAATGSALRGVIVTGDASPETAEAVKGAGFRLLRKPVDVDQFINVLARHA